MIIWKRGSLEVLFWILGTGTFLLLILFLYDIGGESNRLLLFLVITFSTLIAAIVYVLYAFGTITIQKSMTRVIIHIRMMDGERLRREAIDFRFWWNYHFDFLNSDNKETRDNSGIANRTGLWCEIVLSSNEKIVIKQVLANWSDIPGGWKYSLRGWEDSDFLFGSISLRRAKPKIERCFQENVI